MGQVTYQNEVTVGLVHETCAECGIVFAMPDTLKKECQRAGNAKPFYCPNGHPMTYQKSEADGLREQLQRERQQKDQIAADRDYWQKHNAKLGRRLSAAKGRITRIRKRCLGGLCTCCEQHFADLESHMKAQHPDAATRED